MVGTEQVGHFEMLVTLPEACRRLGIGRGQLRRARERGEIPVYVVGGWVRVRWGDVLDWLATKRRAAMQEHTT
jgi:excisionase family DNA binding protein